MLLAVTPTSTSLCLQRSVGSWDIHDEEGAEYQAIGDISITTPGVSCSGIQADNPWQPAEHAEEQHTPQLQENDGH